MSVKRISKLLSVNDTGENGSHQAGILVPKDKDILSFFPVLDATVKNPRANLAFTDEAGTVWNFSFIYYNNKLIDDSGTRNEYRLTGMTKYMRANNAHAGDTLLFSVDEDGNYSIVIERSKEIFTRMEMSDGKVKIRIMTSNSWRVVTY